MLDRTTPIDPPADLFCACLRDELRAERSRQKAKNGAIASALGLTPQTVSGWFTGSGSMPRVGQLYELCAVLGVPLETVATKALERARRFEGKPQTESLNHVSV